MSNKEQFTNILESALQSRGLSMSDTNIKVYTLTIAQAVQQAIGASYLWSFEQVAEWLGVSPQVLRNRLKILTEQ